MKTDTRGAMCHIGWGRLTRRQAVNFFITTLIVEGYDLEMELVIDGEPGPFLAKVASSLEIDWDTHFPKPGADARDNPITLPGWKAVAFYGIIEIARKIGYRGETVSGIVPYLQSLPEEGPIGEG